MRLICYRTSPDHAKIVKAPVKREWVSNGADFGYRCLPMNIANSHGWFILNTVPSVAIWDGGAGLESVSVTSLSKTRVGRLAVSHFGHGIVTFVFDLLFRTEPGYDLYVCGPVNLIKDGIQPLAGIVETDWSCASFTMNWKFTRPNTPAFFFIDEPICMFFPIKRGLLEEIAPEFRLISEDPGTEQDFELWRDSRKAFNESLRNTGSDASRAGWQKEYFRGAGQSGNGPANHKSKLSLQEFK